MSHARWMASALAPPRWSRHCGERLDDGQRPDLAAAVLVLVITASACVTSRPALAWGDEGHKVIALIARHYRPRK